jgi:hypothetical protein
MSSASNAPAPAPVTAVVAQRVKPERTDQFRAWQEELNRASASFVGFLGTDVIKPTEGDEWTSIYRFDSAENLDAWLASEARRDRLDRGASLFAAPPRQNVLLNSHDTEPVTVVVSHRVSAGREDAFREFQERMTEAERGYPGFLGFDLFPPVPGVQEDWTAVYRFDSTAHLDAWLQSPQRAALLAGSDEFSEFSEHRISAPFGNWFSSSEQTTGTEPPAWKTTVAVLVGLYPTIVLLTLGITELWPGAKLWWTILLSNVISVALLTWVVMPLANRALRFWLAPNPRAAGPRMDALGLAISVAFLTLTALVFWLVTSVIWNLP